MMDKYIGELLDSKQTKIEELEAENAKLKEQIKEPMPRELFEKVSESYALEEMYTNEYAQDILEQYITVME